LPVQVKTRSHSFLRILIWTVGSLVILTGLTEVSLRLLFGLGNPIVVTPDAACSYIEAPNQHTYRFFHEVDINQYGMRSDAFAPHPSPGTLRIMFVGDSVAYGTSQVGQQYIFTQLLRRDLPSIVHHPVEVLNASASGWAIDNELSYIRSRGIFNSALVLLVLNNGDVSQPPAVIQGGLSQDTTYDHPKTAIGELWSRYLKFKLRGLLPRRRKDQGDAAHMSDQIDIRANLLRLAEFQQLVTDAHARLAIVYLPFRSNLPNGAATAEAILHQWSAAHHVPLFDLSATEESQPTRAITLDGAHFNVRGNRLVAQGVEEGWSAVLGDN